MTIDYVAIIAAALEELEAAARELRKDTNPYTPMPRMRRFDIVPGKIFWPYDQKHPFYVAVFNTQKKTQYYDCYLEWYKKEISEEIIKYCSSQPRLILRALRRIQAATAWCLARAEGRRRQAEEILRQQQKAVQALEAEAAMLALK